MHSSWGLCRLMIFLCHVQHWSSLTSSSSWGVANVLIHVAMGMWGKQDDGIWLQPTSYVKKSIYTMDVSCSAVLALATTTDISPQDVVWIDFAPALLLQLQDVSLMLEENLVLNLRRNPMLMAVHALWHICKWYCKLLFKESITGRNQLLIPISILMYLICSTAMTAWVTWSVSCIIHNIPVHRSRFIRTVTHGALWGMSLTWIVDSQPPWTTFLPTVLLQVVMVVLVQVQGHIKLIDGETQTGIHKGCHQCKGHNVKLLPLLWLLIGDESLQAMLLTRWMRPIMLSIWQKREHT